MAGMFDDLIPKKPSKTGGMFDDLIPQKPMSWADVPGQALQNTPASAWQFAKDMVQPIMHPIQTADSVLDLAAGGISRGIEAVVGDQSWLPENKATATADAVGSFYKDRYGSEDGFKRALATDPIGVLGDAATVLTGGSGAVAKVPVVGAKASKALQTASRVVNPATPVAIGGRYTTKVGGAVAKPILGATTGTSSETVGEAYRAGRRGGAYNKAFKDNLRGNESQDYVIQEAKDALGNIADNRSKQYQQDMARIGVDTKPVDMGPITQSYLDAIDSLYEGNLLKASDETLAKLEKIGNEISKWQSDPAPNTAKKIDALKIRIDQLMPSFTEAGNSERIVTQMRNVVKQAIVDQVPEYADAMKSYEVSKAAQTELERALSLGKKNSADTTLRKLQSVTRNNANTNYGSRLNAVGELEKAGAGTIMPRLAGQAMNTWTPRGIMKPLMAGGAVAGYFNPLFLAGLPFASPRLVGEGANAIGRLARRTKGAREVAPEVALLLSLLGNTEETAQPLIGR